MVYFMGSQYNGNAINVFNLVTENQTSNDDICSFFSFGSGHKWNNNGTSTPSQVCLERRVNRKVDVYKAKTQLYFLLLLHRHFLHTTVSVFDWRKPMYA